MSIANKIVLFVTKNMLDVKMLFDVLSLNTYNVFVNDEAMKSIDLNISRISSTVETCYDGFRLCFAPFVMQYINIIGYV